MIAQYSLLSLVFGLFGFSAMLSVFFVFGWCDPAERERRIAFDIFSGIMSIAAIKALSSLVEITQKYVKDTSADVPESISQIAEGFYRNIDIQSTTKVIQDEVLGLIFSGVYLVVTLLIFFISIPLAICFIFRMLSLLDIYINNIVRYVLMALALIYTFIIGTQLRQPEFMWLTALIGLLSIARLVVGSLMLSYSAPGDGPKSGLQKPKKVFLSDAGNVMRRMLNKNDNDSPKIK